MNKPSVVLPPDIRRRFAAEVELIRRTTRTPMVRAQAIDYAIAKLRKEHPEGFRRDERYERMANG